jgi:histone deacetylase complex regulatory component SIN3
LLEDFKQFLPESAAQAKAAAAAKAAEDAAALANNMQTPQGSQGMRGEAKMPPVGNFAVPASTGKENKGKRPLYLDLNPMLLENLPEEEWSQLVKYVHNLFQMAT